MNFETIIRQADELIATVRAGLSSQEEYEDAESRMNEVQKNLQALWVPGLKEEAEAKENELLDAWGDRA